MLAVEQHEGDNHGRRSLWLVVLDPRGPSQRIARFTDAEAAETWKRWHNAALMVSREMGRSGL